MQGFEPPSFHSDALGFIALGVFIVYGFIISFPMAMLILFICAVMGYMMGTENEERVVITGIIFVALLVIGVLVLLIGA